MGRFDSLNPNSTNLCQNQEILINILGTKVSNNSNLKYLGFKTTYCKIIYLLNVQITHKNLLIIICECIY